MSSLPIIDTHIHFWDRARFRYPWLETDDWAAIRDDYLPRHLAADAAGHDVRGLVHVQADIDRAIDPVEETAWLASLADSAPQDFPQLVCIGYADLCSSELDDILERHARHELLRGIRQEAWFDPASTLPGVLSTNLLLEPAWLEGLRTVMRHGLSFELLVKPEQLALAAQIFRELPDLPVVLEHTAVPVLTDGVPPAKWREGMRTFARSVPHSVLKISAMGFIHPSWKTEDIRPLVLESIEIFGPARCMFGSNFPVERPSSSYSRLWQAYDEITRDFSASERAKLFHGTAERAYRLELA